MVGKYGIFGYSILANFMYLNRRVVMKQKKWLLFFLIIIGGLIVVFFAKKGKYKTIEEANLMNEFGNDSVFENGVLKGNNQIIFGNSFLCYKNFDDDTGLLLCSKPGCKHNNEDCMAILDSMTNDVVLCRDKKLYIIGKTLSEFKLYCCNFDGSEHSCLDSVSIYDNQYGEYSFGDYYIFGDKVYISISIGDTSELKLLDNGTMSDMLMKVKLFVCDLDKKTIEELYTFDSEYYNCAVFLEFIYENELYFRYQGDELPYEQMYDLETGKELLDTSEYDVSYVGKLDLQDFSIEKIDNRVYGDFIGCNDGIAYWCTSDENYNLNGHINGINLNNGDSVDISIPDLNGKNSAYYTFNCLSDSFSINILENYESNYGSTVLYSFNGEKLAEVDNTEYYVIGECGDYYLLSSSSSSDYVCGYISKKDIMKLNKKMKCIDDEEVRANQ